jgi:hypothetical protein
MKEHIRRGEMQVRRKIRVLYSLGGIGKTQLAIEYARLHKAAYSSFGWLDGKTEESLIQSFLAIMPRLPKGQIRDIDIQVEFQSWHKEDSRYRADHYCI